jgi:HTH-type transcriptional regulator/antitoxin HigA
MLVVEEIETAWDSLSPYLFVPRTEAEYDRLVLILDELLDEVREDESHPLASLLDIVGTLIGQYEDENVPEPGSLIPPNYERK